MIRVSAFREDHGKKVCSLASTKEVGAHGNFEWSIHSPGHSFLNPLALDLLEIGKSLHMADRMFRRSFRLGQRTRKLAVRIPVIDPRLWRREAALLEYLAGFSSADIWRLEFVQAAKRPVRRQSNDNSGRSVVALFSGGLDSLCGVAHLAQTAETPIFVSHSPPGRINNLLLIRGVWNEFRREYLTEEQCITFRLEIRERDRTKRRSMFQEHSRRTRPVFFLALACAVAIEHGIPAVQMSENGALGLSLPLRADAHGAMCSRQAHEVLLRGFARLLNSVAPRTGEWQVLNPFARMTKGEACGLLKGAGRLAKDAISCEYVGRQAAFLRFWKKTHRRVAHRIGDGPQCGLCVPCLIRRAALFKASIPDPDRLYFFDAHRVTNTNKTYGYLAFGQEGPPIFRVAAEHVFFMRRFCDEALRLDEVEFSLKYMPELRFSVDPDCDINGSLRLRRNLIKRLAKEMLQFLDSR
jgi:hypothetical protein